MSISKELSTESAKLQFKVLHLFNSLYPVVSWDIWKTQVLESREVLNPHRRYGLIWFHIPSVCLALRKLDYDSYHWLNNHSPFFKQFLISKTVCVDHRKTLSVRGIKELKFWEMIKQYETLSTEG